MERDMEEERMIAGEVEDIEQPIGRGEAGEEEIIEYLRLLEDLKESGFDKNVLMTIDGPMQRMIVTWPMIEKKIVKDPYDIANGLHPVWGYVDFDMKEWQRRSRVKDIHEKFGICAAMKLLFPDNYIPKQLEKYLSRNIFSLIGEE